MAETREQKRTTVNYGLLWFKPRYLENFELLWLKLLYQKLYQKLWNFDLLWEKLFWLFFILLNTFKYNSFEY